MVRAGVLLHVCLLLTLFVHDVTVASSHFSRLTIWIDQKEVHKFSGVDVDIYVVRYAEVLPYLKLSYIDRHLPVLPPEVNEVTLTWEAPGGQYRYYFSDLRSLDSILLYDPLITIPITGYIPRKRSAFKMAIPCKGQQVGIASFYIAMHISDHRGPIRGSPLKLHLRKQCKTFAACLKGCLNNGTCVTDTGCVCRPGWKGDRCEQPLCQFVCRNGGQCVRPDKCECKGDFHGPQCQYHKDCKIPCKNGGVCSGKNICKCAPGYHGRYCEKPTCRRSCSHHGACVAPNKCRCHPGWFGKFCNKSQLVYYELYMRRLNRRRNRRRFRHQLRRSDNGRRPRHTPGGKNRRKRKPKRRHSSTAKPV